MLYGQAPAPTAAPKPASFLDALMQDPEFAAKLQQEQGGMAPQAPQAPMAGGYTPTLSTNPGAVPFAVDDFMKSDDLESRAISEMPAAPPEKKLGLFGRINAKPGGSKALLTLGAHLLSSPDFFTGLGQGALAFQNTIDEETEKLKPKVEYLANGAFQLTTDPVTGERRIERTPVADFEQDNLVTKLTTQEKIAGNRMTGQIDMNNADNLTVLEGKRLEIKAEQEQALADRDFEKWKLLETLKNNLTVAEMKGGDGDGGGLKAPPVSAIKQRQQARLDRSNIDQSINSIDVVLGDINSGVLNPNLAANAASTIRSAIGGNFVTPYDEAKQRLTNTVQRAVRSILSSNVGVQTQMDAQRAEAEILSSTASPALIRDALNRLKRYLSDLGTTYDGTLEDLEATYDFGGGSKAQAAPAAKASGTTSTGVKWRVVD
ncbi:hypothetical protein UFOVP344_33 [uncultured Caudovirales phage]|uniref:Uncharacterized protein n=1 Tax=uncultured Caudovirales phage TaxID=2100421 RepID=A0A6J5LXD5_9CAUD|nr:hypothetical protein UFOVP344_33 [uncultured Caudovirales phage]